MKSKTPSHHPVLYLTLLTAKQNLSPLYFDKNKEKVEVTITFYGAVVIQRYNVITPLDIYRCCNKIFHLSCIRSQ